MPLAALVGIACSACFAYASGVLLVPMTAELGWSRAGFSSGFTVMMICGLIVLPLAGRLTDRIGARQVVLWGVVPYTLWFALLALTGKSLAVWWLLCAGIAACTAMLTPPVWISPVVSAFRASRGMALALALSGIGLAMAVWPSLAAVGVQAIGWRATMVCLGVAAGLATLAASMGLPRHATDSPIETAAEPPMPLRVALRSRTFLCIAAAGGLFASVSFGLALHFVAILRANGVSPTAAAGVAGLIGIFSIIGRLGTGLLLDRVPTRAFGVVVFLLPVPAVLLLLQGTSTSGIAAAAIMGLAGGAEFDIVAFLAASRFPRKSFASIYASATSIFAVCASTGPLLAGALFDTRGSYDLYLILVVPIVAAAAIMIALVPPAVAATIFPGYDR